MDVYPRGCGYSAPVGTGLNAPAVVTLHARGVVEAAAAAQPGAAAAGEVALRLRRRDEDGRATVWTYAVPLAGGAARVLAVTEAHEEPSAAADAPENAPPQQPQRVSCAPVVRKAEDGAAPALQLSALLAALPASRATLDDVDD